MRFCGPTDSDSTPRPRPRPRTWGRLNRGENSSERPGSPRLRLFQRRKCSRSFPHGTTMKNSNRGLLIPWFSMESRFPRAPGRASRASVWFGVARVSNPCLVGLVFNPSPARSPGTPADRDQVPRLAKRGSRDLKSTQRLKTRLAKANRAIPALSRDCKIKAQRTSASNELRSSLGDGPHRHAPVTSTGSNPATSIPCVFPFRIPHSLFRFPPETRGPPVRNSLR